MSDQKHQRVVALDSMTLVWGIRKHGASEKTEHAGFLFSELERDKAQIIIPSVVVAEYITPISSHDERTKVVAAMSERFFIVPFDADDAVLAAKLYSEGKSSRAMKKPGTRVCLRADALIVATAKNHGAQEFYTDDNDCYAMASKIMTARRLPTTAPYLGDFLDK